MMNYQVYNQDCRQGLKSLADESVDLIFTDPPFGIQGQRLDQHYNRQKDFVIQGYKESDEDYETWSTTWIKECERILKPKGSIYIVSGWSNQHHLLNVLHQTSLKEINHLIAEYTFGVYTKRKWVSSHYHILFWAKSKRYTFNTNIRFAETRESYRDRLSVQTLKRQYHPGEIRNVNQLPESFITKFIEYSSNPGDTILDPFSGSFSTGQAARKLGRHFIGFEINPDAFNHFSIL